MHGSTFRTSRTDRERRRTGRPPLTLVRGAADRSPVESRVTPCPHPGAEGFTPDGGAGPGTAVHRSGPESPSVRRPSRGSASPDVGATAISGPGPHVPQAELVRHLAAHLATVDGERPVPGASATVLTVVR